MTEYEERELIQYWAIAKMCAGGTHSSPYSKIANDEEKKTAEHAAAQIDKWLKQNIMPNKITYEAVWQNLIKLHSTLFNRRLKVL